MPRRPTAGQSVLLVTPHFRPHVGGVEQYVEQLAETLRARHGLRPVIVTTSPRGAGDEPPCDSELTVRRLPAPARVFNTPVGLGWARAMRRLIRQERAVLVNAHAPVPLLADLTARAVGDLPFVLTYHTGPIDRSMRLRAMIGDAYERLVLPATARRADRIVCSSQHVATSFARAFGDKSVVIPPAVDMAAFVPAGPGTAEPRRILFVGSLERTTAYKALPDLLEAMRRIRATDPRATLHVVGDGDARPDHELLAARLGLGESVRFLGHLGREAIADQYRQAGIVCHPTHHDSFPTVLVEAMACARPVVSTLVGGIPSLVTDGSDGLLYPAADIDALTRALERLLDSPGLGDQMGARGRAAVAERLSRETQSDRTMEVFSDAVIRRTHGRRRVAILAPYYPPKTGGVEHYAHEVAGAVAAAPDMDALVITSNHAGRRRVVETIDGVTVIRLGRWFRLSNTPINPLWPLTVRRLLARHAIDVINVHSPVPFLADAAILTARCPVVFTYHSGSMAKPGQPNLAIREYERHTLPWMFRHADAVVAVSGASLGHAVPGAITISPGVDQETFSPGAEPPSAAAPSVLYVGRLERSSAWKGVDHLLRAFAGVRREAPGARLRLVGDGDARPGLEALARTLGIAESVDFEGFRGGADLVEAYRTATVLVLPSLTDAESFGMTLVEAMACGRPVIGSRVGGIPEVIDDGVTGLLVPPGDTRALTAACLRILGDGALADRLGRAGREEVLASHGWSAGLGRYLELFRSLTPAPELSAERG